MNPLLELDHRGFEVAVRDGRLAVGPADRITPELRKWIQAHKATLIEQATAYAQLRDTNDKVENGVVPDGWTAIVNCVRCGLVWADPGVAAVLPVVNGHPQALGCPWCHVRAHQTIPRPSTSEGA